MDFSDLIAPDALLPSLKAGSKKQVLQTLATKAAESAGLDPRAVFDVLLARERLGSTGIGQGVAIPHGRMSGLDRIHGLFARLDRPIPFDASDDRPVDLVFVLLAPEGAGADHLKALARIARLLRDDRSADALRNASDKKAIYALLTRASRSQAA